MSEETCPGCYGNGVIEIECCSGAGGCSCRGGLVYLGHCQTCDGDGYVCEGDGHDPKANLEVVGRGYAFAGSGPNHSYGIFPPHTRQNGESSR